MRAQSIEGVSGWSTPRRAVSAGSEVLAGKEAMVALIAGWRAGWRRRSEWYRQETCFRDSGHSKFYQQRMSFYARQVQEQSLSREG